MRKGELWKEKKKKKENSFSCSLESYSRGVYLIGRTSIVFIDRIRRLRMDVSFGGKGS